LVSFSNLDLPTLAREGGGKKETGGFHAKREERSGDGACSVRDDQQGGGRGEWGEILKKRRKKGHWRISIIQHRYERKRKGGGGRSNAVQGGGEKKKEAFLSAIPNETPDKGRRQGRVQSSTRKEREKGKSDHLFTQATGPSEKGRGKKDKGGRSLLGEDRTGKKRCLYQNSKRSGVCKR